MTEEPGKSRRRSLSHLGGPSILEGKPDHARQLAHALDVRSAPAPVPAPRRPTRSLDEDLPDATEAPRTVDDDDRRHVHGFHTYPARMHPETAARLVEGFSSPGATVFDPFCGSGTVLVEALRLGRNAYGTDLNPLAVALARLKTTPTDASVRRELVEAATAIAAFAHERRKAKAGATRRYPPEDVAQFDPHVLLELDSLRAGIDGLAPAALRETLGLVLSSILVKVSRKRADTSNEAEPTRRIAAGFPTKLFRKKTEELALRLEEYAKLLPSPRPTGRVLLDDATRLESMAPNSCDVVISSPPYAATYDYLAHHEMRLRWLGLESRRFQAQEVGSRRSYAALSPEEAQARWEDELFAFFSALRRPLRKGGSVVLLMADSAVRNHALRADLLVPKVAAQAGFAFTARASQERPHFHGATAGAFRSEPRREHLLLLVKEERRPSSRHQGPPAPSYSPRGSATRGASPRPAPTWSPAREPERWRTPDRSPSSRGPGPGDSRSKGPSRGPRKS